MKKFRFAIASFGFALLALALPACSDDDNTKDEPLPPVEDIVDTFLRDAATASITPHEFESKVMGKVWERVDFSYVDTDGVDYGQDYDLMPVGGILNEYIVAYCFNKDKYVKFYKPSYPNYDGNNSHRTDVEYTYDATTGMVYSKDGEIISFSNGESKHVLFYIESVTDDTMVIHEEYRMVQLTTEDIDFRNVYTRTVLKAIGEQEAQTKWWDKYVAD